MRAESNGLVNLNAFEFVDIVPNCARWVFACKVDKYGNVMKPKSRLVAGGFNQMYTVDSLETYAPIPVASTVKYVVVIVVGNNYELR